MLAVEMAIATKNAADILALPSQAPTHLLRTDDLTPRGNTGI
jgi:hypothetical protein